MTEWSIFKEKFNYPVSVQFRIASRPNSFG